MGKTTEELYHRSCHIVRLWITRFLLCGHNRGLLFGAAAFEPHRNVAERNILNGVAGNAANQYTRLRSGVVNHHVADIDAAQFADC